MGDNHGVLVIAKKPVTEPSPAQDGLTVGKDTTVTVGEDGWISSQDMTFEAAPDEADPMKGGRIELGAGGIYADAKTIVDNVLTKDEVAGTKGGITFKDMTGAEHGATVQLSGQIGLTALEELTAKVDAASNYTATVVVDHVEGIPSGTVITEAEMDSKYGGAVLGDAILDVTASDDGDGAGADDLHHGGAGSVIVTHTEEPGDDKANGTLKVKPNDTGKTVTITGSETNESVMIVNGAEKDPDREGFNKPIAQDPDNVYDIVLEDGADLALGKDGAMGGTLTGSITTSRTEAAEEDLPRT